MSVIPSELTAHHGSTVSILGHKVSTDALLIAGASLIGILVLWRMAKPSGAASIGSTADQVGTGANFASPPIDYAQLASAFAALSPAAPAAAAATTPPPAAAVAGLGSVPQQPIYAQPLGVLQIHAGDTPQSLAAYWDRHGFNFTAQQLIASNMGTPFQPGNVWDIWRAGQGPSTIVGYH